MLRIAIIEPLGVDEQLVHELMQGVEDCTYEYFVTRTTDEDELIARAKEADAIVVANVPLSARVLAACPYLRMISVAFTGLDHIDLAYCEQRGIQVQNCSGYSTEAVAEEAFGLMLSLFRHLGECDRRSRAGGTKDGLSFRELAGKTLGVVGNGAIAQRVIELAHAFRMETLCYARNKRPLEGVRYMSLDDLCHASDVVSVHVPATPETHHLVGAKQIALMKPSAVLINTARGPVVDTDALVVALNAGAIAGAGLDVLDGEPPFDPVLPILHAPNTIIAPHIGFATQEALDARARMAIDHVADYAHMQWLDACSMRG